MYLLKVRQAAYFAWFNFAPRIEPFCKVETKAGFHSKAFKFALETSQTHRQALLGSWPPYPLALPRLDRLLVSSWGGHKYQWEQPLGALYGQPPWSEEITLSSFDCQYTSHGNLFQARNKLSPCSLSLLGTVQAKIFIWNIWQRWKMTKGQERWLWAGEQRGLYLKTNGHISHPLGVGKSLHPRNWISEILDKISQLWVVKHIWN